MLVVYSNGDEVIVGDLADEKHLIKAYFGQEIGRDTNCYDRVEAKDVKITTQIQLRITGHAVPLNARSDQTM